MQENNETMELSLAVGLPKLLADIDFNGLNAAIESIANNNGSLTDKEKELAVNIVGEWERTVIERVRNREYDVNSMLNSFDPSNNHISFDEEESEQLALATGTMASYKTYQDIVEQVRELRDDMPEKEPKELGTTVQQQIDDENQFTADMAKYQIEMSRLQRREFLALKAWKKELANDQKVKDMIANARKFKKNISKLNNQCSDKARLAKLNISISSQDVRDSLRSLINFSIDM